MLTLNSIIFMCCFESIYLYWGFASYVDLFSTFFNLVRSIDGFYYFGPQVGLSIFTDYKNSIKGWIEHFAIIELKESSRVEWDINLSWGDIPQGCNEFSRLNLIVHICLLRLTSIGKKYDVKKCLFMSSLKDCHQAILLSFSLAFPFCYTEF